MKGSIKWKEVIHKECGKPALLQIDKVYFRNQVALSSDFRQLKGDTFEKRQEIACGSCGDMIRLSIDAKDNTIINGISLMMEE